MEIKVRPIPQKQLTKVTWYDYKMAIAGTLLDYGLYLRMHGNMRDRIVVFRSGVAYSLPEARVYEEVKHMSWKEFYENELPKIIEEHVLKGLMGDD